MTRMVFVFTLLALTFQVQAATFAEFINNRIMAQVNKRNPATQQIDPPAALLPEANVADLAAAADVASLALSFAGVGDEPEDAQSVTASAYALIVGATGGDPDDIATRRTYAAARRWFLTVATKDETDDDPAARLFQAKWLVHDGRELSDVEVEEISKRLDAVGGSTLTPQIRQFVLTRPAVLSKLILPRYREALLQKQSALGLSNDAVNTRVEQLPARIGTGPRLQTQPGDPLEAFDREFWTGDSGILNTLVAGDFGAVSALLTKADREEIDEMIVGKLDPFADLAGTATQITAGASRRSQFALAANLLDSQSDDARKTFGLEAIYAKGLSVLWNFTANAQYKRPEAVDDDDELTVAALFRRQIRPKVKGKEAMYLDFGGDASLLNDERTYRAQAKATITLLRGLQVPISVTWANRDALVDESSVVGHIGISFDFSKAGEFFKRSAPEDEE